MDYLSIKQLLDDLAEVARLQEVLKAQSMIYQREEKEKAAKRDGLSHYAYYNLSYSEWCKIRNET